MGKLYFMVILGETEEKNYIESKERLEKLGVCKKIMLNTYVLTVETDRFVKSGEIRDKISGEESLYTIVIRLDSEFSSGWSLTKDASDYLKSIFKSIYDDEQKSE